MKANQLEVVKSLVSNVAASLMGKEVRYIVSRDKKQPETGRIYIQCVYTSLCTQTGKDSEWKGRKWYLSDHMTGDEVVKTCYAAFKAAVEHEVMEGFTYNGDRVFNPHTPFTALIQASKRQVFRQPQ